MAHKVLTSLTEGRSLDVPPFFDGTDYTYWKDMMTAFIKSMDYKIWKLIKDGPQIPLKTQGNRQVPKSEDEWDDNDIEKIERNARAMNILFCSISQNEYYKIYPCTSAKQMWDGLEVIHEGTNEVKEEKIQMLVHSYERFMMKHDESIEEMFNRFSKIVNTLKSLGKVYVDGDLVGKILFGVLPKNGKWEHKVMCIRQYNDLNTMTYDELRGNLIAHEIFIRTRMMNYDQETEDEEVQIDEKSEMVLLFNKICKMYKTWQQTLRDSPQDRKPQRDFSKDSVRCYECKMPGHVKSNCPTFKKKSFGKEKATITTWSDDDEFDLAL